MASLITPTILKTHVETDLDDEALQRIIDAEEMEIIQRFGAHTAQTQDFETEQLTNVIYPTRKVGTVSSIIERVGDIDTSLDPDDYEVQSSGKRIDRLSTGTNPSRRWGDLVRLAYVPEAEAAKRIMVLIDLCKLSLGYGAVDSENIGDYSASMPDYEEEREKILNRLIVNPRWYA